MYAKVIPPKANKRANPRKPYTVRYSEDGGTGREISFKLRRDADEWAIKFLADNKAHVYVPAEAGKTSLAVYAAEWLDRCARTDKLRPRTVASYRHALKAAGAYADKSLAELAKSPAALDTMLADVGCSASWRISIRAVIVGAMDDAVANGKISKHALATVKITDDETEAVDPIMATDAELRDIAGYMGDLGIVMWIQRGCGLRASEACAVRADWFVSRDDGDWLIVKGQRDASGGIAQLKMKRRNQHREVPVPAFVMEQLGKYLSDHAELPEAKYGTYRTRLLASAKKTGRTFTRASGKKATAADFTTHMLRHAWASVLLSNGVSLVAVSKWLGHADARTTSKVYAHALPRDVDRARDVLDATL